MNQLKFPQLQTLVPLKNYTTLKVGGLARYLVEVTEDQELLRLLQWADQEKISWFVMGKGSNLLISESGFEGLVLINKIMKEQWQIEGDVAYVWAGAGENMAALAARSAKNDWSGIEFACGIPGSVGGAVAMNAGAHGRSISESLVEVVVCSKEGFKTLDLKELDMRYRHSRFLDLPEVVVAARFRLLKDVEVKNRLREMTEYRLSTQPWKAATAGCFFRNPENCVINEKKCSAGFLIEKAGLKGFVWKGAKVSDIHANFLVNNEAAKAEDFIELCEKVREKVHEAFGVWLEGEVRFLKNTKGPLDYV